MKKTLLLILIIVSSINTFATHIQGYDMSLQNIPNTNTYKVIFKIYRWDSQVSAPMPFNVNFVVYNQNNTHAGLNFTVARTMLYNANYEDIGQQCLTPDANENLQVGVFEYTFSEVQTATLNSPNGYYVTGNICCRVAGATNVDNSDAYGVLFTFSFPRISLASPYRYNNSPRFSKPPLMKYYVGKMYQIDWSATDADGDSLIYKLVNPLDDGFATKPFLDINYKTGYGITTNLADGSPDFVLDSVSGIITYKPTIAGSYIVAVLVEEYRNGVKIGEVRREMQFSTVIPIESAPVISSNNSVINDITDTIDFTLEHTKNYNLIFKGKDIGDSISMYAIPDLTTGENIFDPNFHAAEFGEVGNTQGGQYNLIITAKDSVEGEFKWKVNSQMGRTEPYIFSIIVRDQTCQNILSDTLNVKLYVNYKKCYVSDTMMYEQTDCDSVILALNNSVRIFYSDTVIMDTVPQQLNCDLIKTYLVRVNEGTDQPSIIGDINITDTSTIYTYEANYKNDVTQFEWSVSSNGSIVGGDGSAMIHIKWNAKGQENLKLIVYNRDNCSDSVDVAVNVDHVVGLNQVKNIDIRVYPSPVNDFIYIYGLTEKTEIEIYNLQGKKIKTQTVFAAEKIDISELLNGIYLIKGYNFTTKILKQ